MMTFIIVLVATICACSVFFVLADDQTKDILPDLKVKLNLALTETDKALDTIWKRWQIDDYPNFLKSVSMSTLAWDILKTKFEVKILSKARGQSESFVVSFLGSSVTAGHDTAFNISFVSLTGLYMSPPFDILGIDFESRNRYSMHDSFLLLFITYYVLYLCM